MLFDDKHRFLMLSPSIASLLKVEQSELMGVHMERFAPEPYMQALIDEARGEGGLDAFFKRPVHTNAAPSFAPGFRTCDGVARSLYSIAHRVYGSDGQMFRVARLIEGPESEYVEHAPIISYL